MKNDKDAEKAMFLDLLEAALAADHARLRTAGNDLTKLWASEGDEATSSRLRQIIRRKHAPIHSSGVHQVLPIDNVSRLPLIEAESWPTSPAILNPSSEETISRFLTDIKNADALRANGVLSKFGLMLSGPPGTGKTLLAGHIASNLGRPFFVVRLDSLISSRLGETAKNVRQIFECAPAHNALLFLDEMDAIAKVRDDKHEVGELKRVVNTVIQGIDSLSDDAVIVAATNHPRLLDPAIWRRFPYNCSVDLPVDTVREDLWRHYLYQGADDVRAKTNLLSRLSAGFSGADIETVALATRRLSILNKSALPEAQLLRALAKSSPPNLVIPSPSKISKGDLHLVVQRLAETGDFNKSCASKMLRKTRQTIINHLMEG